MLPSWQRMREHRVKRPHDPWTYQGSWVSHCNQARCKYPDLLDSASSVGGRRWAASRMALSRASLRAGSQPCTAQYTQKPMVSKICPTTATTTSRNDVELIPGKGRTTAAANTANPHPSNDNVAAQAVRRVSSTHDHTSNTTTRPANIHTRIFAM